ncbi:hypothetical protein ACKWTF_008232 [Chironomus riparius]
MNKLKAITRSVSFNQRSDGMHSIKHNRHEKDKVEPVVGFKVTLHESASDNTCVPELEVNLIGARHLPSNFGLKTVEGYMIKVKLFPGTSKFDSSIQTSSWPKFNESFRFPMASSLKSSMKNKYRDFQDINGNETLPQKLFKGTFVVFTVIALLELPDGTYTGIKGTYKSLKRQGSIMLRDRVNILNTSLNLTSAKNSSETKNASKLTTSETQRNIGSVTFFLDPKVFEENAKSRSFFTNEMWLPIKDITVPSNAKLSVSLEHLTSLFSLSLWLKIFSSSNFSHYTHHMTLIFFQHFYLIIIIVNIKQNIIFILHVHISRHEVHLMTCRKHIKFSSPFLFRRLK